MTYKVYHNKSQSNLHWKAVTYIQSLLKEEASKFMEDWGNKVVSINDGGYYHSGRIIECKPNYNYGDGKLEYKVTLVDFNREVFYLYATNIMELSDQQYALAALKKQLETTPWSKENENELYHIKEFADQLDINDIIVTDK